MLDLNKIIILILTFNACLLCCTSNYVHDENSNSKTHQLNKMVSAYQAIVENINLNDNASLIKSSNEKDKEKFSNEKLFASDEIVVNKQILIVPTKNTISSEENFQFEEYFSRSSKERLIGRLLLEKAIGKDSIFFDYIQTLPNYFNDFHHFDLHHKEELKNRILYHEELEDRKEKFESLVRKIPSNTIPNHMLNFDMYNWASSVIDCFGILAEKKFFSEVKKLDKYSYIHSTNPKSNEFKEILLIPGINIFDKANFEYYLTLNLKSSIFAYKEHIYLNSDRYIDENEPVYNEIQFQANTDLFQYCGKYVEGIYHEEAVVNLRNKEWSMIKYDLCKLINCIPNNKYNNRSSISTSISSPTFVLKYEFDNKLFTMCQVDQYQTKAELENIKNNQNYSTEDEIKSIAKILKAGKKISNENYIKSIVKCHNYLKEYLVSSKSTLIEQDIKTHFKNKNKNDEKLDLILKHSISQKKIVNYHLLMFANRFLKEVQKDIFIDLKSKYV